MKAEEIWVVGATQDDCDSTIISRNLTHLYIVKTATNRNPEPIMRATIRPSHIITVNRAGWSKYLTDLVDRATGAAG